MGRYPWWNKRARILIMGIISIKLHYIYIQQFNFSQGQSSRTNKGIQSLLNPYFFLLNDFIRLFHKGNIVFIGKRNDF
jgi:hypothetical protein